MIKKLLLTGLLFIGLINPVYSEWMLNPYTGKFDYYVPDTTGGGLANVVEDTTPQLGGDLDLNSKNIDFPTTANISDCKDEDNFASNSATMLATQQSIKAYVDGLTGANESDPTVDTSAEIIAILNATAATDLEHEIGGLEADVSGYNGFVYITGGATSAKTPHAGTDVTADLEEEAHASEHAVSGADTIFPADPNADKYLMWDDDPGALVWQTVATLTDGDKGDITVSDSGATWNIDSGTIGATEMTDGAYYYEFTLLPAGAVLDDDNPAAIDVVESSGTATPRFFRAKFDDGDHDALYFKIYVPSDMASGNWTLSVSGYSDEDVDENVVMATQLSATSDDDVVTTQAADSVQTVTLNCNKTAANSQIQGDITISNLDSVAPGDEVVLVVYRDGDNVSDDHTNEFYVTAFRLKIPRS